MDKYKVSFLPTQRSRKMKSIFVYANTNDEVIQSAKKRLKLLYPDNELISIQAPDYEFIDIPGQIK